MKTPRLQHRLSAIPLLACLFIAQSKAGIVKFINVRKDQSFLQTGATHVALKPASTLPFTFAAEVDGDSLATIATLVPAPTLTLPSNSQFHSLYKQTPSLGLGTEVDDGWNFGYVGKATFDNWGTKTKAELDAAFPNGNYVFKISGRVINLSLTKDTYPTAPVLVLSGGSWVNGIYHLPVNKALTINSGTFAAYGTHTNDLLDLTMVDTATNNWLFEHFQLAKAVTGGPPQSSSKFFVRKFAANALKAGHTYSVSAGYQAFLGISTSMPGAIAASAFGRETELSVAVDAVP